MKFSRCVTSWGMKFANIDEKIHNLLTRVIFFSAIVATIVPAKVTKIKQEEGKARNILCNNSVISQLTYQTMTSIIRCVCGHFGCLT